MLSETETPFNEVSGGVPKIFFEAEKPLTKPVNEYRYVYLRTA